MGYLLETGYIKKKVITIDQASFLNLDTSPFLLLDLQPNTYALLFGAACVFGNPGYYTAYQHLFINDGNISSPCNIARFDESIVNSITTVNFAINILNNTLGYTPNNLSGTSLYLNAQSSPSLLIAGTVDIILYYTIIN